MTPDNLNLLFNKLYFDDLEYTETVAENGKDKKPKIISQNNYNSDIINRRFDHAREYAPCSIPECSTFLLQTVYPGLLIGIGNSHDAISSDDAFKLGFSFDYTSGLPIIHGSTVKGVLRSHFREHPDAVSAILNHLGIDVAPKDIKKCETEIFEDEDCFLDAVVYKGDSHGLIVGKDYITPHGDDATKSITPLMMLRILPDVKFEFRFVLKSRTLSAESKLKLFEMLFILFGIGGKTNVGYGRLVQTSK